MSFRHDRICFDARRENRETYVRIFKEKKAFELDEKLNASVERRPV